MARSRDPRLKVPAEVVDAIESTAVALDVQTGPLAAAVLLGVARAGQIERFMHKGAEASQTVADGLVRRRDRPAARKWTAVTVATRSTGDGRVVPTGSSTWTHGPWRLDYVGNPSAGARRHTPGTGWHLYGPGIGVGIFVGWTRAEATEAADLYIDRWDAARPDGPVSPPDPPQAVSAPPGGLSGDVTP